jgi:drug/metabolite transporter (DMT)-like permease
MVGSGIINTIKPFCKKHILNSLDGHEFVFLNTFLITSILLIYFIYLSVYQSHEKYNLHGLYNKYTNLSKSEICAIVGLSLITLSSTFIGLHNQNKITNVKNNLIMKSITTILIIAIGIYMYEEEYNKIDIIGIIFILCGIYLVNN